MDISIKVNNILDSLNSSKSFTMTTTNIVRSTNRRGGAIRRLKTLNLSINQIVDISPLVISKFPLLQNLNLDHNRVVNISAFSFIILKTIHPT